MERVASVVPANDAQRRHARAVPRAAVRRRAVPRRTITAFVVLVLVGGALVGWAVLRWAHPAAAAAHSSIAQMTVRPEPPGTGPLALKLTDGGTVLTVTWIVQRSPMAVALSRAGDPPIELDTVPAGVGNYLVRGVETHANYCVVVTVERLSASVSPATSVCTRRP